MNMIDRWKAEHDANLANGMYRGRVIESAGCRFVVWVSECGTYVARTLVTHYSINYAWEIAKGEPTFDIYTGWLPIKGAAV